MDCYSRGAIPSKETLIDLGKVANWTEKQDQLGPLQGFERFW